MEDSNELVMDLIINAGNAKSSVMEAIQAAKKYDFETAEEKLKLANSQINKAHNTQTDLLTAEANGDYSDITLLMVHAQDHLMTTLTTLDLAKELVDVYKITLSNKD